MSDVRLILGDCLDVLPTLPPASFDCVLTDPPYPCIKRNYGTWTEAEWFEMMRVVVPECMRILKPTGSVVFVLQPNSERVGRMRTWLWEFMLWVGKEWGIVQDAWWWNNAAVPEAHAIQGRLMRPSVKACVWIGPQHCWRNQSAVLWTESNHHVSEKAAQRFDQSRRSTPSGQGSNSARMLAAAKRRGGVTPFNLLPVPNQHSKDNGGLHGHGAATPAALCDWWLRYLCPPGGSVLDPFSGTATVSLAALKQGKSAVGIEQIPEYHAIAEKRIAEAQGSGSLFDQRQEVETNLAPTESFPL